MKYPRFLKEGGTIGFPAPSFGCSTEPYYTAFRHALEVFREKGFQTVCGPNAFSDDGIGISSSPENCGREFTQMFCGNECDALISCGGGELMCEILDHVDFDAIKKAEPKWFMGYSDNTNLSFLLASLCDTASVYGPCASTFGMEKWHPSLEDAFRLILGEKLCMEGYDFYETESLRDEEHPIAPYHCTEPVKITAFLPGKDKNGNAVLIAGAEKETVCFSGRLIGGCLDCLVNLCGTCYDKTASFAERYKDDGIIWFLEACDLNVFGIRRAVWELQHAGWFRHVKGFLIGRPLSGREEMMGLDHIRAVTDLLAEYSVPVILDADLGHLPPMMPLIVGSMAEVSYHADDGRIRIAMSLT